MLRVVTLNIHKGLSHFNRRMVIHDLRDGLARARPGRGLPAGSAGPEPALRAALRHLSRSSRSTSSSPARSGSTSTAATRSTTTATTATRSFRAFRFVSFENQDVSDHRFERRGLLHCVVVGAGMAPQPALRVRAPLAARARPQPPARGHLGSAGGAGLARRADHRRGRLQRLAPPRHRDPRAAPGNDRGVGRPPRPGRSRPSRA